MKPMYLLDTNVLLDWLNCYYPFYPATQQWQIEYREWVRQFCEECTDQIFIPDIVWVEFLSVFLHKKIYVEEDYKETLKRFREQTTILQQMEHAAMSKPNWDFWTPDINPFRDAWELMLEPGIIDPDFFDWLKKKAEKNKIKYGLEGPLTQKLLDGMDSAILIYLSELAHNNKDHLVYLLTGDLPLAKVLKKIKLFHNKWFAQNTNVVFTLMKRAEIKTEPSVS